MQQDGGPRSVPSGPTPSGTVANRSGVLSASGKRPSLRLFLPSETRRQMKPNTDDPHNILDGLNQLLFVGLGLGAIGALAYAVVTNF
jgi:hypothetical protein